MKLDELKKRYETSQAEHNHNYRAMLMRKIAMEAIRLAEVYRSIAIDSALDWINEEGRSGPKAEVEAQETVDSEAEKLMENPK